MSDEDPQTDDNINNHTETIITEHDGGYDGGFSSRQQLTSFKHWNTGNRNKSPESLSSSMRAIRSSNHSWLSNTTSNVANTNYHTKNGNGSLFSYIDVNGKGSARRQRPKKSIVTAQIQTLTTLDNNNNNNSNVKVSAHFNHTNVFIKADPRYNKTRRSHSNTKSAAPVTKSVLENFGKSDLKVNQEAFARWLELKRKQAVTKLKGSSQTSVTKMKTRKSVIVSVASQKQGQDDEDPNAKAFAAWLKAKKSSMKETDKRLADSRGRSHTLDTTSKSRKSRKRSSSPKKRNPEAVKTALSKWLSQKETERNRAEQKEARKRNSEQQKQAERLTRAKQEYDNWFERKSKIGWVETVYDAKHEQAWISSNDQNEKANAAVTSVTEDADDEANVLTDILLTEKDVDDLTTNDSFELVHQQHHTLIKMLRCPMKTNPYQPTSNKKIGFNSLGTSSAAATLLSSNSLQMNPVHLVNRHPSLLSVPGELYGDKTKIMKRMQQQQASSITRAKPLGTTDQRNIITDPIIRSRRESDRRHLLQSSSGKRTSSKVNDSIVSPVYPPSLWMSHQRLTKDFPEYCKRYPYLVPTGGSEFLHSNEPPTSASNSGSSQKIYNNSSMMSMKRGQ